MTWQSGGGGGGGYPGVVSDSADGLTVAGSITAAKGFSNNPNDTPGTAFPAIIDDGDGITAVQITVGGAGVGGGTILLGNNGATSGTVITLGTSSTSSSDAFLIFNNGSHVIGGMNATGDLAIRGAIGIWNVDLPAARPVLATGAGHTVDDVIALLQLYGFCKQA